MRFGLISICMIRVTYLRFSSISKMFRSKLSHVNQYQRFYRRSADNIFNARRIVDSLRRQYELKKLQHITATEKDKAVIHSLHAGNTNSRNVYLNPYNQHSMNRQDLYGPGYTSTDEV